MTDQIESTVRTPGAGARRTFVWLNVLGGALVLASYAWGTIVEGAVAGRLWGGVPEAIRPVYTVNMLLAAVGYFLFAPYIAFRVDSNRRDILGAFPYPVFSVLMLLVLVPSAIWLPLTAWMIADPSDLVWALVRVDLALVGVGSLGLSAALATLRPPYAAGRGLAIIGTLPFCLQTVVLDALVWPAYFGA